MTNYTPNDTFPTVQYPDLSDLVQGGLSGNTSASIEQLADRTQYLFNRSGGYIGISDVTATGSITNASANKLISIVATANVTLTLDALSTFKVGTRLSFVAKLTGSGPFWLNVVTPDSFFSGNISRTNIWLYDGEMIEIIRGTSAWHWIIAKGNFDKIGEVELKRFQPANTFLGDGTTALLRATYPRLWEAVSGSAIADNTWLSDNYRYRQQFTVGNGTTTFRRPDYRAMFFRALDGGRNVSIGRLDAIAGGYEQDKVGDFTDGEYNRLMKMDGQNTINGAIDNTNATGKEVNLLYSKAISEMPGYGTETKPKNVGFNPYIYY
mgnify:CR=1 FL=1